jgi:hypothetical protein
LKNPLLGEGKDIHFNFSLMEECMMSFAENIVVIWMVPVLIQIILPLVLLLVFGLIQFITALFQPVTAQLSAKNQQDGSGEAVSDGDIAGELKTARRLVGW